MKLKDKKIELLRQVHTRDEMGFTKTTLESMGTVWAYFRHLSGKEVFAAATVNYKEEVLFQVNYRTDLTPQTWFAITERCTISPGLTPLRGTKRRQLKN